LRRLIEGKRKWHRPERTLALPPKGSVPNASGTPPSGGSASPFLGWHERGYLPHRDEPGLTQFVTFHLADSFPESLRSEWEHLWKIEDDQERCTELEAYLDKGRGNCHLRRSEIAQLVEDAVRFFHGDRYDLRAWIVMPNHVHALFKVQATPMAEILEQAEAYVAGNTVLLRRGEGPWVVDRSMPT